MPESRDAGAAESHAGHADSPGSSRNAENGSHLAEADAAEGHAGHADSSGGSRNGGNGSHLEATDAAEGHAGQVDGPGSSGNAENGSHLAETGAAESLAGGGPSGVNENGQVGRWDFGKGKARAALSARKCHQRYIAICPV